MNRVAIVVQRCHESIVGGSESLAWQYANLLKDAYEVDVLTTTALETSDWANILPEGVEIKDGIRIRRFPVTIGRSPYWSLLHDRLWAEYPHRVLGKRPIPNPRYLKWSLSFQEEFIRTQGPYSTPLLDFLSQKWSEYKTIIFVTYLYPTTYFGLLQIPKNYAFLAPTLHDEPTAYLSAYKHAAHRARSIIWLTDAERRVGSNLWGELPGQVVSAGIETALHQPAKLSKPYLLYCGRIDPNKGCRELFDYFIRFKSEFPSELSLVLAGKNDVSIPNHPDIEFRGFVPADEKYSLMAGATLFVMPSRNESFSFVTMEAMAQQTPVLASSGSEVLVDHITRSGAGRIYNDYMSFAATLAEMLSDDRKLQDMGSKGRDYVVSKYQPKHIHAALTRTIENGTAESHQQTQEQAYAEFRSRFDENLKLCEWLPHPDYSVFTQYDQEYYLERKEVFLHKYRCMYAVSKTILPRRILELGTLAGSAADAYLSGSPNAEYVGIDVFGKSTRHNDGSPWDPYEIAKQLFRAREFKKVELIRVDLRSLTRLPYSSDLVVVDAAHDVENEYADLKLALTANPTFIFVDDSNNDVEAKPAIERFLKYDLKDRVEFTLAVDYTGGGLVIKLTT
ncbi:MAG: glycosyltransferase [Acidobacteriota bacterium]|nr:glycosyltransferase [Acidobacteriota bacterium]